MDGHFDPWDNAVNCVLLQACVLGLSQATAIPGGDMTRRCMLLAAGLAAVLLAGCGYLPTFGDPLQKVDIENATAIPLRVYQDGERRILPLEVAPHATAKTAFPWPIDDSDGRVRMILAEDATGKRIYCQRFTYADLVKADWKIRVIEHDLCG